MKHLKLITLVFLGITILSSCKKDDNNNMMPEESIALPSRITVEKTGLIGTPSKTYFIGYNSSGKITSIRSNVNTDRVDHIITYENDRISEIIYNSPGNPTITSFTYNNEGIITGIQEFGPEARDISNFEYNDDDNSYVLTLNGVGLLMFYIARDNQNHIEWYDGSQITFSSNSNGLFKNSIGDITPLYLVLPYTANQELYYFSKYQIESANYGLSAIDYEDYETNTLNDITSFTTRFDADTYINYSITY